MLRSHGCERAVTRHRGETTLKNILDSGIRQNDEKLRLDAGIHKHDECLLDTGLRQYDEKARDWIPPLGFGFLRRSTDYIHVIEGRYDNRALLLIQPLQNLILHLCANTILNPGSIL